MPSDSVSGKTSSDIENVDWSVGTGHLPTVVRFGSSSSQTSQSSGDICRICHCECDPQNPLLTPCYCSGSLKYVHQACLQQWLTASETNSCELCKFPFIMHTKIKPFNEWRSLDMSGVERRRLFCAVLFHCAAALCVIWSLCVLIERAAEEVKRGEIGWPFWTKLVVVTVGLTGGVVFMYIQCRQYLHLCNRWRARNRILLIQNAPEKFHPPQSPILQTRNMQRNSSSSTNGGGCLGVSIGGGGGLGINNNNNSSQNYHRPQLQGQIVANIENNPMHYERDWTLDDVSQVSFKPCPQGSGSLTPFTDPMYENTIRLNTSDTGSHDSSNEHIFNQISSSSSALASAKQPLFPNSSQHQPTITKRTNDLSLFKIGSEQLKYPASAVFLENRDILNDNGPSNNNNSNVTYPKLYHRHSAIIMSPDITENLDKFLGKDLRRYSDTKLLTQNQKIITTSNQQIFNVTNILGPTILPATTSTNNLLNPNLNQPQITDIIFERSGQNNFDPLELNIQEMLELDIKTTNNSASATIQNQNLTPNLDNLNVKSQLSLTNRLNTSNCDNQLLTSSSSSTASSRLDRTANNKKNLFKSLPNLNASSENLLQ